MLEEKLRPRAVLESPVWTGREKHPGTRRTPLSGCGGEIVAEVARPNRLLLAKGARMAEAVAGELREIDDDTWFGYFRRAADLIERELSTGELSETVRAISDTTGLPRLRVERGITAVTAHMRRLADIMAAQSPDGSVSAYRTGEVAAPWAWLPAGRTCMVRVPGNFPTIQIEWLQTLAARRPTLVNTSERDPFTAAIFASALYRAGLPDGAVSLCHGDAETWVRLADQVVWPGENAPPLEPSRLKTYHFGRSKAVLLDDDPAPETWTRLARLAFQGSGRLCTNVSSLAVVGDAESAATRLAEAFDDHPVLPLTSPRARVPAFPDRDRLHALVRHIKREVAAGAVDVTARHSGTPLLVEIDGAAFLRPTVLLTDADSPLFRTELPFPFTAVARVDRNRLGRACSHSLIVSVVGEHPDVARTLAQEPTITKVFGGDMFDRGYDPVDPQEGYLADFLFQKKALLP
ncbi:aldehyde dehydrogenase family protein [Streptomyces desertarenae]|uniref:Aldehyde dehydrogenase family protein n=1 Tax=Streptomyces desertarenae TaxID=2666184 RepID=A0ABW4PPF5_9ACTN